MKFEGIRNALTRIPFMTGASAAPAAGAAKTPPDSEKSLLVFGHEDSAMRFTMLEVLRDMVAKRPDQVRGLVIGLPFEQVERTLNAIGFDTASNLISFNAPRSNLRFRDAVSGALWHVSASEFARIGESPGFTPGVACPIPAEIRFNDRLSLPDGRLRHRHTGRVEARPTSLIFDGQFSPPDLYGFDGIAGDLSIDVVMDRLHHLYPTGLNATHFLRCLLTLIRAYGKPLTTTRLYMMMSDPQARMTMLEYFAANLDAMPPGAHTQTIRTAFDTVWGLHDNVPKMASTLADSLFAETYRGRDIVPGSDLIIPGKIWHIGTDTVEDRYTAYCVKQELQMRSLDLPPGDERTLIFAEEFESVFIPGFDTLCLNRPDIFQCFGVIKAERFTEKQAPLALSLMRGFHRHFWHLTTRDADIALFEMLHPTVPHPRQQLTFLPWEHRIESSGGLMRENAVDLDVDGTAAVVRARRTKLRTTIDRGGFAID